MIAPQFLPALSAEEFAAQLAEVQTSAEALAVELRRLNEAGRSLAELRSGDHAAMKEASASAQVIAEVLALLGVQVRCGGGQ